MYGGGRKEWEKGCFSGQSGRRALQSPPPSEEGGGTSQKAVWRSIRSHAVTAGATTLAVGRGDHGTLTRTLFLKHPLSEPTSVTVCLKHTSPEIIRRLLFLFSSREELLLHSLLLLLRRTLTVSQLGFLRCVSLSLSLPCHWALAGRPPQSKCRTADPREGRGWMPSMCTPFSRSCGRASSDRASRGPSAAGGPTGRPAAMRSLRTTTQVVTTRTFFLFFPPSFVDKARTPRVLGGARRRTGCQTP
ncbi:hypothetical protein CEXT_683951 [Caerostris extrusa]|uniref:Uncharacterized protein n=1 Tax=Caerostris extrusa TaxID=172846 RepID=A0AAV4VM70_CAEEX|nr:hypothetical protein CEXT_683951 [Caerostris extrusa]